MRKIFISAGHSNKPGRDRGAEGNGYIEGELSVEFRNKLVIELKKLGISAVVDSDNTILSESITYFKNQTSKDSIVLDIHWNAATPKATGTETLIPGESTDFEKKLAKDLSSTVSTTLGIPLRGPNGVKTELESHHGRLGWMRLSGENVLMELCFISSKGDMEKYETNKDMLAQKIAQVLYNYANDNRVIENPKFYTVSKGDTLTKIAKENNITLAELIRLNNITTGSTLSVGQILKIK